jgi:small subunit ribosomal protein S16
MLTIRLQRLGKVKKPSYRLVISENEKDTQGRSLEILGIYNPVEQPKVIELKADRIKHWLSQGAQTSNTVHNLLVRQGIVEAKDKKKSISISDKRQVKIDKKKSEKEDADKQKKESAEAEAVIAEKETPVEEEKPEVVSQKPEEVKEENTAESVGETQPTVVEEAVAEDKKEA